MAIHFVEVVFDLMDEARIQNSLEGLGLSRADPGFICPTGPDGRPHCTNADEVEHFHLFRGADGRFHFIGRSTANIFDLVANE
jgi:hypothetical protein